MPILVGRVWLLTVAGLSAAFGLLRRNKLVLTTILWVASLYLMGNAYRLGITFLGNLGAVLIMLYLPVGLVAGSAAQELVALSSQRCQAAARLVISVILSVGFIASHVRVTEIEPHRYFVTQEDIAAMEWIRSNTEADATFAVNTYFWLPHHPHGTDAGYWIPYFTGRQMTAAVMVMSQATLAYKSRVVEMSEAAERLESESMAVS